MEKSQIVINIETIDGKFYPIESHWSLTDDDSTWSNHNPTIEDEISDLLFENIRVSLKKQNIKIGDLKRISFDKIGGEI